MFCRKNEVKSLEEKQIKDNQAGIDDLNKLESKFDGENRARIDEIKAVDNWKKLSKLSTHGRGGADQLAIEVLDIVVTEEEMVDKVKGVVINY